MSNENYNRSLKKTVIFGVVYKKRLKRSSSEDNGLKCAMKD